MDMGQMLADQIDRLLRPLDGPARHRAEREGGAPALWANVAGLGLETALVPEDRGGAGLGWRDIGRLLMTLGYHAAPLPLGEAMIAHWALDLLGQSAAGSLPGVAPGSLAGETHVTGQVQVPWGQGATQVLVTLTGTGGRGDRLALVDAGGARVEVLNTLGRDPAVRIVLHDAPVLASAETGGLGLAGAMALLRSAQIAGALSRILELSIEYGNTRVQFGRPIGKFQAVQHLVAGLAAEAAAARAAVDLALAAAGRDDAWQAVATAKIRTALAVPRATFAAHETHGAIGVTEEHVLHYFTRRLWQWREEAGDEHLWSERLGQAALQAGGAGLWALIVSLSAA